MRKVNIKLFKILLLVLVVSAHGQLSGHLKSLGSHLTPMSDITTLNNFPSPLEFYELYVKEGKPVLFKNVLENVDMPAYYKWTDEYLVKHYGSIMVEVELNKKEDRKNWNITQQKLSDFLRMYNDTEMYLIQNLKAEMEHDMAIPSCLSCGGFQKVIQTVVIWFSSGGTKSQLHHDDLDNTNCLLDGRKDLIMIDKKYSDLVEADGWHKQRTFSDVDVDAVDMHKFPKIQDIPWYQVNLTKGDCFYIPYKWYHYVYSHPGRNFAVNVWYNHLWWFNVTDCNGADPKLSSVIPYTKFTKPQEIEDVKQEILKPFAGNKFVSRKLFLEKLQETPYIDIIFENLDQNNDEQLSWEEMYMLDDDMVTMLTKFKGHHDTKGIPKDTQKEDISSQKQSTSILSEHRSSNDITEEQTAAHDITDGKINNEKTEL